MRKYSLLTLGYNTAAATPWKPFFKAPSIAVGIGLRGWSLTKHKLKLILPSHSKPIIKDSHTFGSWTNGWRLLNVYHHDQYLIKYYNILRKVSEARLFEELCQNKLQFSKKIITTLIITLPAINFDDSDGRRRPSSESSKARTSVTSPCRGIFSLCCGLFSSQGQHVAGLQEPRSRVHQYSIIIIIIMIIIKIIKNK